MAMAILYPASMSIIAAFNDGGAFSLGGFQRVISHSSIAREFATTLMFAAGSTAGAALIGVSLAWIIARTDVPGRRILEALCIIPLFMSARSHGACCWFRMPD
jgi:iron(III) transport system permease protein